MGVFDDCVVRFPEPKCLDWLKVRFSQYVKHIISNCKPLDRIYRRTRSGQQSRTRSVCMYVYVHVVYILWIAPSMVILILSGYNE